VIPLQFARTLFKRKVFGWKISGHAVEVASPKNLMARKIHPDEYYYPCIKSYQSINNKSAQKIYFEETEPDDEQPTHHRILHVQASEAILQKFITQLTLDVLKNSAYAWKKGTPLPAMGSKRQPLAEGQWEDRPDNSGI